MQVGSRGVKRDDPLSSSGRSILRGIHLSPMCGQGETTDFAQILQLVSDEKPRISPQNAEKPFGESSLVTIPDIW